MLDAIKRFWYYPLGMSVKSLWKKYTEAVNSPDWTISEQAAKYYQSLLKGEKATHILDLGIGFSSIVAKLYADNKEAVLHLFDTRQGKAEWLPKLKAFLKESPVSQIKKVLTKRSELQESYEVIFYDLYNTMRQRIQNLDFWAHKLKIGGCMLINGGNNPELQQALHELCKDAQFTWTEVQETVDEFGRTLALLRRIK